MPPSSPENNDTDIRVAWRLSVELVSRITLQPLPLRDGVETAAFDSIVNFFRLARDVIAEQPGCVRCAPLVIQALNEDVRPFTARWHGLKESGRLHSMDERHRFRAELASLQSRLRRLAERLADIAGMPLPDPPARLTETSTPSAQAGPTLPFGLTCGFRPELADEVALLNQRERESVMARRRQIGGDVSSDAGDAVGLALSGGGLRSATFCLGVLQSLGRRGLLEQVDFMSTVSGGGYIGSLISMHGVQALQPGPGQQESTQVRHLRNHSKYLAEGGLATWALMAFDLISAALVPALMMLALCLMLGIVLLTFKDQWRIWAWFSGVAAVVCLLALLLLNTRFVGRHFAWFRKTGVAALVIAVLYGAVALILTAGPGLQHRTVDLWSGLGFGWRVALVVALVTTLLFAWALDPNAGGLHRYYRERLGRAFLQSDADIALHQMGPDPHKPTFVAPYHLINAALNIPASRVDELRGRRSDFFVLSRHFCGSTVTGWRESPSVKMDLATAMSISAAAASPHMGTLTRRRSQLLLSLLGWRLGRWLAWPQAAGATTSRWSALVPTGWVCFIREITGLRMDEKQSLLYLSDGGHIENLGIHELLRRRCRYIIAIDGEHDPQHEFGGLLNLIRIADIDMGVKIAPDLSDLGLNAEGLCGSHFVLARVKYPEQEQHGLLLYIKSSMTGNETEFLRRYRRRHPDFPHQSTAQQLFDEERFEAYRALGEHVGDELFAEHLQVRPQQTQAPDHHGGEAPVTLPQWFAGLESLLLAPASRRGQ